jgi:hypothetical protein
MTPHAASCAKIRQEELVADGKIGTVWVSRRRLLIGARAAAAVLTAGGATAAIVQHERGAGSGAANGDARTGASTAVADPGPNPLDDPDTRLRHLLRRTSFAALLADVVPPYRSAAAVSGGCMPRSSLPVSFAHRVRAGSVSKAASGLCRGDVPSTAGLAWNRAIATL